MSCGHYRTDWEKIFGICLKCLDLEDKKPNNKWPKAIVRGKVR